MIQKSNVEIVLRRIANTIILNFSMIQKIGLLDGKMGRILFLYHYFRRYNCRYEEYADKWLDEVLEKIQVANYSYAEGLAGIGTGIEYLAQHGFIENDTNSILEDIDIVIHNNLFPNKINIRNGIVGYGKYYLARLNNSSNDKIINSHTEFIKEQLSKIVDLLSTHYDTYEDLYSVFSFLPDVIALNINHKEKSIAYLNYAVEKLETMVYEDLFFGKKQGLFNPLVATVLLLRAAKKTNNDGLVDRAMYFLNRYEVEFRQYFSMDYAIKLSFLYQWLWKACNCNVYKKLSIEWFEKGANDNLTFEYDDLATAGMMLLTMNKSISDDWLDWFPIY